MSRKESLQHTSSEVHLCFSPMVKHPSIDFDIIIQHGPALRNAKGS